MWCYKIAIWVFFINRSRTAWSWWSRETLEGVDYLEVGKAAILFEEWDSLKDISSLHQWKRKTNIPICPLSGYWKKSQQTTLIYVTKRNDGELRIDVWLDANMIRHKINILYIKKIRHKINILSVYNFSLSKTYCFLQNFP